LGRLRVLSGDAVCAILLREGFRKVRQRGSHRILQRTTETGTVTIPVPVHDPLRPGTLLSIIRQSSLPKRLFEEQ
jgi:predicted RNA binding protein YcfA (HicA-like mRNA interferase family)